MTDRASTVRLFGLAIAATALVGCSAAPRDALDADPAAALVCTPQQESVEGRASPYDSVTVRLDAFAAKVCYGRPAMRERAIFGPGEEVLVPYGQLWRTGANEPTTVHVSSDAEIAGLPVGAGAYSIYTIPSESEWTVIVNRSTSQWGYEPMYTPEVEAQEVGRATVRVEPLAEAVERFTIRAEPDADSAELLLEWERTRVRIPIRPAAGG